MKFYSPSFDDYKPISAEFTCDGENHCPLFMVGDVSPEAKELILICHDPDATGGLDWTHWLVSGISPKVTELTDKNLPPSAKTHVSSFGDPTYGGPCPPQGNDPHRYVFSLYAIDEKFDFDQKVSRDEVLKTIAGHILAQATWTGTYQRLSA